MMWPMIDVLSFRGTYVMARLTEAQASSVTREQLERACGDVVH